jgi:hypothetical protein
VGDLGPYHWPRRVIPCRGDAETVRRVRGCARRSSRECRVPG